MNLELHIQLAGILQLLLVLVHSDLPSRFHWKEELARLSLLNRQVFWVHTGFVMLTLCLFGLLSLLCTKSLMEQNQLARAVLGGLTIFWLARWICQFFVYDSELWRGNRFYTVVHICFSVLWTYFVAVYGFAFWRQL